MDCGGVPNSLGDLVWTFVGDSGVAMAGAGAGGTFSFSGTPGGLDLWQGRLSTTYCNNTPNPVTIRFTFTVNFNIQQGYGEPIWPDGRLSTYDFFTNVFWNNTGVGTDVVTCDIGLDPCETKEFWFYMSAAFNFPTNTCAFSGSFTGAIL